ncbi:hypothetical protein OIU79_014399, partial [Salix purpurea]
MHNNKNNNKRFCSDCSYQSSLFF